MHWQISILQTVTAICKMYPVFVIKWLGTNGQTVFGALILVYG